MNTTVVNSLPSRRHRRHSAGFKAQMITACLQPGVSIAAVALANGLNSHFLRTWVKAHREPQRGEVPATINLISKILQLTL